MPEVMYVDQFGIRRAYPVDRGLRKATAQFLLGLTVRTIDEAVATISPTVPTVTLGTSWVGSTITNSILVPFKTVTPLGDVDVANDPHFEYIGYTQGSLQADAFAAGYVRPSFLPGGSSQQARYRGRLRFMYTGSQFELRNSPTAGTIQHRTFLDDFPCTTAPISQASNGGSEQLLKWDFGSYAQREVQLELPDPRFGGIYIQPDATISRIGSRVGLVGVLGDSLTGGAVGVGATNTWLYFCARLMGAEYVNLGIGGTGYIAGAGTNNYRTRLDATVASNPALLYVWGGYNDDAQPVGDIYNEALYVMQQLTARLPATVIILIGCWSPTGDTTTAVHVNIDNALRAVAVATNVPFISLLDPLSQAATTPAWLPATAYVLGDLRVANGRVWKCRNGHTSGGTFAVGTNWQSVGFMTGTGSVGALANNGNRDRVIGSTDQVHLNQNGHYDFAWWIKQRTTRILRTLVGQTQ
jgi:hypothetical protein